MVWAEVKCDSIHTIRETGKGIILLIRAKRGEVGDKPPLCLPSLSRRHASNTICRRTSKQCRAANVVLVSLLAFPLP